ncbi:MAG TPA: ABC transporter substrate-binding protein [Ramlibacter sp.]|uniref:ABC transporter substrate-binding protein n=1 Tax=Ramlibacter sp. TaxID=1917967 RepID=UPI002C398C56|nr:ABC transporter substrate-binding protein [Ramlibacter sp.]HVZ45492.1 ABC transporter substrate-binding protein [Ramlibacter sp.]
MLRYGYAGKLINSAIINMVIPEDLGYYKEEGIRLEFFPLGSYPATLDGLRVGTLEFGTVATTVNLPLMAKGESLPIRNFMEYTYPFKWGIAVKPESKIRQVTDLKGKRVGIPFFGSADLEVGKLVLGLTGMDPERDVQWIAVGEGTPGGLAIDREDIDALFTYDSHLAAIEAAGIAVRYLPLPAKVPKVGGWWLGGSVKRFSEPEYRRWAVAFGRSVAKANIFIRENPEAAAYLFITRYPETAPAGQSVPEKVKSILKFVEKRAPLYAPYDKAVTKWGYTKKEEMMDELDFNKVRGKVDPALLWTNELIDDINHFDAEKIRRQAREFAVPYKR